MNWRGRPLTSHETIVQLIGATTTNTGLTVTAALDTGSYPTGIKISDREMRGPPHHPRRLPRRLELHPVRHEAPVNRVEVKGLHRRVCRSGLVKLGAA